jgi:hypothetical protein
MTGARRSILVFALISVVGLCGLLLAAATDRRADAFSLNQQISQPLAPVYPHQTMCEGPIAVRSAFSGIHAYIGLDGPPGSSLTMSVRTPSGATLTSTSFFAVNTRSNFFVGFPRVVSARRRVFVCVYDHGPVPAAFFGAGNEIPGAQLVVNGKVTGSGASMVFLLQHPPSLLGDLPTVFSRAVLFRPGWVGVWTFWLLGAGVLLAFVLVGRALWSAAAEDALT